MNELIMPHNVGVKNVLDSMKEVLALYKKVTGNYRTLQEYRNEGILPYIPLGGKILYRESDLEELLEKHYHPAYRTMDK